MLKPFLAAAFACGASLIQTVADPEKPVVIGKWTLVCQAEKTHCHIATEIQSTRDPAGVWVQLKLDRVGDGANLMIKTPPLVEPRVQVIIDDHVYPMLRHPVCTKSSCDLTLELDYEQTQEFKRVEHMTVTMALQEGQVVELGFELENVERALGQLPNAL